MVSSSWENWGNMECFTVFIVLFLYKCPKVLNNMYISIIEFVEEVPYSETNVEPLNYTVNIVITAIC